MNKREVRVIKGIKKIQCYKCKYWLSFDEFHNSKASSVGKTSSCKICVKSYDAKRRPLKNKYNSGLIGLYLHECLQCKNTFTSKSGTAVFCSDKCRKHNWYLKNDGKNVERKNYFTPREMEVLLSTRTHREVAEEIDRTYDSVRMKRQKLKHKDFKKGVKGDKEWAIEHSKKLKERKKNAKS